MKRIRALCATPAALVMVQYVAILSLIVSSIEIGKARISYPHEALTLWLIPELGFVIINLVGLFRLFDLVCKRDREISRLQKLLLLK